MFEHKGYTGVLTSADAEAKSFHGRLVGIQDVVTFEGKNFAELADAFRDSVEDYLDFCAQRKEEPEKPFSGKFVVRLPAELHRAVAQAAHQQKVSLNTWVVAAMDSRLKSVPASQPPIPFEQLEQIAAAVALLLEQRMATPFGMIGWRASGMQFPGLPGSWTHAPAADPGLTRHGATGESRLD